MRRKIICAWYFLSGIMVILPGQQFHAASGICFLLLCFYTVFRGNKGFDYELNNKDFGKFRTIELIVALAYLVMVSLIISFGEGFAKQIISLIAMNTVVLVGFSLYGPLWDHMIGKNRPSEEPRPTVMSSFMIPKLFLIVATFLVGNQLNGNISFVFILGLATYVLWELIGFKQHIVEQVNAGNMTDFEVRHYLFHRWSKYMNFFLITLFLQLLLSNGIIGEEMELIGIFAFTVLYLTYTLKMVSNYTLKDFLLIAVFAAVIVGVDFCSDQLLGHEMPTYLFTLMVMIFYDLMDVYFHARQFKEVSLKFWEQKGILYLCATIFLSQVYILQANPYANMDTISASVNPAMTPDALEKVEVKDAQNASHVRTRPPQPE